MGKTIKKTLSAADKLIDGTTAITKTIKKAAAPAIDYVAEAKALQKKLAKATKDTVAEFTESVTKNAKHVDVNLGKSLDSIGDLNKGAGKSINTPYGPAIQSSTKEAQQLRNYVDNGGELYRGGTLGRSNVADAQFWAPESPLNPGYAGKYGVDFSKIDYVIGGKQIQGSPFITRHAPGLGKNIGGGLEIVNNPNSVRLDFFHMP